MSGDYSDNYVSSKRAYIFLGNKNQVVKFKPFLSDLSFSRKSKEIKNDLFFGPLKLTDGSEMNIKLSFKVLAANEEESWKNHQKFQKLIRMIMPLKNSDGGTGGKLNVCQLYVKFANLIHNQIPQTYNSYNFSQLKQDGLLCNISSIDYKPDVEMGFFEGSDTGRIYAKAFAIDLDLDVVKANEIFQKVQKNDRQKRNRPGKMFGFEIKYE